MLSGEALDPDLDPDHNQELKFHVSCPGSVWRRPTLRQGSGTSPISLPRQLDVDFQRNIFMLIHSYGHAMT